MITGYTCSVYVNKGKRHFKIEHTHVLLKSFFYSFYQVQYSKQDRNISHRYFHHILLGTCVLPNIACTDITDKG